MKKAIALLLVVLLAATAVFAAGNTVKVRSIVGKITIKDANDNAKDHSRSLYQLYIVNNGNNVNDYTSNSDISAAKVTADFVIIQNETIRASDWIDLSITAGALSMTDENGTYASDVPVLSNPVSNQSVGSSFLDVQGTARGNILPLKLTYGGPSKEVPEGSTVCTFSAEWAQKTDLSSHNGTYTANITLEYTIQ